MGARQADRSSNEELMNADLRTGFPKLPRIISESSINESKIRELRKKYK